eukprot:Rmarinus@m.16130
MAESVKVAVRVRPFNQREKDRNSKLIIEMNGGQTRIKDPSNGEWKTFSFDFSFWSHDSFTTKDNGVMVPNPGSSYADQQHVFDTLGKPVLDNAWQGYNCSLFAYGQTGSGKSYSMVGYGENKGIVPITCDVLFKRIKENTDTALQFRVTVSMLEIYNEKVQDLLIPPAKRPQGGLQVRESPKTGVYVDGLTHAPVSSYEEIEKRMDEGTSHRTVAATAMNATSSRAHTIVGITFCQIKKDQNTGKDMEKRSAINLIDLAGSERQSGTGATGDRLKEGSCINQSLSALGNVISALAEMANHPKKKIIVPYRNSKLTRILQDALGGNSKTIMICALSPADINYDETLSTLRYADRAKQIKNKAVINESPTDKLIRELKEENARLMKMLGGGKVEAAPSGGDEKYEEELRKRDEEMTRLREMLEANTKMMETQGKSWEEQENEEKNRLAGLTEQEKDLSNVVRISNLNEDPVLSNKVHHEISAGTTTVVKRGTDVSGPSIPLAGLSIQPQHAIFTNDGGKVCLEPKPNARVLVNAQPIKGLVELKHMDRVLFGSSHLYIIRLPNQANDDKIDWEFAQKELAEAQGFSVGSSFEGMSDADKQKALMEEDIVQLIPLVQEANAISEELKKDRVFKLTIVSNSISAGGRPVTAAKMQTYDAALHVHMTDLKTSRTWLWSKDKFMNRVYIMRDVYEKFEETGSCDVKEEEDPFWDPVEETMIGMCTLYMSCLAYKLESEEWLKLSDYKGNKEGELYVELNPCSPDGSLLGEDDFVEDPEDMLGKRLDFMVVIKEARGVDAKYSHRLTCRFKFYLDQEYTITPAVDADKGGKPINFNYKTQITVENVTKDFLKYLEETPLQVELYGAQESTGPVKAPATLKLLSQHNTAMGGELAVARCDAQAQRVRALRYNKKLNDIRKLHDAAKKSGDWSKFGKDIEPLLEVQANALVAYALMKKKMHQHKYSPQMRSASPQASPASGATGQASAGAGGDPVGADGQKSKACLVM